MSGGGEGKGEERQEQDREKEREMEGKRDGTEAELKQTMGNGNVLEQLVKRRLWIGQW